MPEPATGFQPGPVNPQPLSVGLHIQPQFDVIEALPPAAADKLRMLRQRAADNHAIVPQFEQVREASMARIEAENALRRLTDHQQQGGFNLKADSGSVFTAQRQLDKATADFERLKQLQATRTVQWQAASAAQAACEDWLKNGRPSGTVLEDFEAPTLTLSKGEGVLDGIERLRRRVRELKADLHRIASAQYPSAHTKASMRRQLSEIAERGCPDVTPLVEIDGKVEFPTMRQQSQVIGAQEMSLAFTQQHDALALTCWLQGAAPMPTR